ncbi:unnamed protein product, partial [Ectocarpus fasciculatus]
ANLLGDFDLTDTVDADDIDWLYRNLGGDAAVYSLDRDNAVTLADVDVLVTNLLGSLFGDANLDGAIEQGDLDAVLNNWGSQVAGWATGDYNGDQTVNQADLDVVLNGWGDTVAPNLAGFAVPEPATALAILLLPLATHRTRRR